MGLRIMVRATNGERDPLEKPWNRRALQEDLAKSGKPQAELGAKYGVSQASISRFAKKYKDRIEEIRSNAADEFAGILLAAKVNRLETYQQMVDDARERGDEKLATRLLHQIADEMGHLPGRVTISGQLDTQTKYTIDGVTQEDLT